MVSPAAARMSLWVVGSGLFFLGVVYLAGRIWHHTKYTELASKLKSLRKEKK